jgi:hypothetical protein
VFSVTVFTALLGIGFQRWKFLCSRAHVLRRLTATSHQRPTTITAVSRLGLDSTRNGSWSSLCSIGKGRTENTAYNSDSAVAYASAAATTWRLMAHCLAKAYLQSHALETAVSAGFTILVFSRHATIRIQICCWNIGTVWWILLQNCACTCIFVVCTVTILVYLKAFKTSRCVRQNKFKFGRVEARDSK